MKNLLYLAILLCVVSTSLSKELSKTTMKNLCEMPEFQRAMAADEELEPAAVVYEVMSNRLEKLESHVENLEKKLESAPTHEDIEMAAAALKVELLDHVDERMDTLASELESNVQNILEKLMTNLANLGYENGFELESHITTPTPTEPPIKDCDYLATKDYKSGVHALMYSGKQLEGFCEIRKDDYNWLVIQRRVEDSVSFYRAWDAYKEGFGDLMGSFYFGNEKIHEITSSREHVLRVELSDSSGDTGFAEYSNFSVSSEDDGYRLHYNKFIGGSAGNSLAKSKGQRFSTFDKDGDESQFYSCSRLHRGAFWYSKCGNANLNGVYIKYETSTFNWENVFWYSWKKDLRSLHSVQMLIRPSS